MAMRPLLALSLAMLWASPAFAAMDSSIEVWKSATCECCGNWVKHLEANGFATKVDPAEPAALAEIKRQAGSAPSSPPAIPPRAMSSKAMCPRRTSSGSYPSIPMLSD